MVVEGYGSYGIVFSTPRIPLNNESYEDVINLNQVGKILFIKKSNNKYIPATDEEIKLSYENVIQFIKSNPQVFTEESFLLPIKGGYIDKKKFVEYCEKKDSVYDIKWFSNSKKYFEILNQLFENEQKIFQIVYERGTKISSDFTIFFTKIYNVINSLLYCKELGFYFDDIKYDNLITHNDNIKIIDFEVPININLDLLDCIEMIKDSKLNSYMYFPYEPIANILLFEYINNINDANKKSYLYYLNINKYFNKKNYYDLLKKQCLNNNNYIDYRLKKIDKLIKMWDKFLPDKNFNIETFDPHNDFNKIKISLNSKIFSNSIKVIYTEYFLFQVLMQNDNLFDESQLSIIINKIFELNIKLIDKKFINLKEKISYLINNINIHSIGFIFVEWFDINIDKMIIKETEEQIRLNLIKIIQIVINTCVNHILIDDNIYFVNKDYSNIKVLFN